jgi:hypothetical protein
MRIVNEVLPKMKDAIFNAPTDTAAAAKVSAAFGKNWEGRHDELKKIVTDMQDAKMIVKDTDPAAFDNERGKKTLAAYENLTGQTKFGSLWHVNSAGQETSELQRAGTMVHELSHQVGRTGDHTGKYQGEVYFLNNGQFKKLEAKNAPDLKKNGGCRSFLHEFYFPSQCPVWLI